ncbi:hypothetical protein PO124_03215 [Bacillus licheniformis]|nr:hypothetical protein [Bacillus licheniformis]
MVILAAVSIIIAPLFVCAVWPLQLSAGNVRFFNVPVLAAVVVGFFEKVPALAVKWAIFAHIVLYTISKSISAIFISIYIGCSVSVSVLLMLSSED